MSSSPKSASADDSSNPAEPELIRAVGEDGTEGYVYTEQVFGSPAANPEDAAKRSEQSVRETKVPLYARDGETVIGTYIANAGY